MVKINVCVCETARNWRNGENLRRWWVQRKEDSLATSRVLDCSKRYAIYIGWGKMRQKRERTKIGGG